MAATRLRRPNLLLRPDGEGTGAGLNRIEIDGRLVERKILRYTPAGVPVSEGRLEHASEQTEADAPRQVACDIAVIGLGQAARWLEAAPLGGAVRLTGFLAAKSRNSRVPVLHVNSIEFLEGNQNGSFLQEEG